MTIHYNLYLASDAAPKEATAALSEVAVMPSKDSPAEGGAAERSWVYDGPVSITAWRFSGWVPAQAEDNGVAAKLGVDFQLLVDEVIEAYPIMLRDVLILLEKIPGDAVLTDLADKVVLRRVHGTLELNLSRPFWTPELRALVTIPYETRIDYTRMPGLEGIYLEDSFVLDIASSDGAVEFALDAVLTPRHPLYHAPREGEQYCFRKLRLRFPRTVEVDWNRRSRDVRVDASGETDLGHIESFSRSGERYHLFGDWGSVEIRSDAPVLIDDDTE